MMYLITVLCTVVGTTFAANLVVTNNNDSGAGSLRQAIADASSGDEITFDGNYIITLSSQLIVNKNLSISGTGPDLTIIQAAANQNTASHRVFNIHLGTISIENLTIRNGVELYQGGGIYINGYANLTLQNCNVSSNTVISGNTTLYGGGIYVSPYANLTITYCSITNNWAIYEGNSFEWVYGGGICNEGSLNISNSTIGNNLVFCDGWACGGGISCMGTGSTITNCTIVNNECSENSSAPAAYGGGIYIQEDVTLSNSTISQNNIVITNKNGIGIYHASGTVNIKNSIVAENEENSQYYDYYYQSGTLTDNGYNVIEYANEDGNSLHGFSNSTNILYNTKHNETGVNFSSWTQGGIVIPGALDLATTLADNGGPTQTLALATSSFAAASATTGIPPASNWNNSPLIDGAYTDQRGVLRTTGQNTAIGAYSANYVPQNVFYVDVNVSGGNNDGSSWANAFSDVQDGIDAAYTSGISDAEVWVAKGKYLPTSYNPLGENGAVLNRTKTFVMKNQVDVYGGFSGNETSIDQRTNYWIGQVNETILSGDLDNNDDYSQWETYNSATVGNDENSYNVVYYYSVSSETILDGFTISGGNANKKVSRPYHDGGGAHLTNKNAYLQNCRIIYNRGNNAGGVITFSGGTLIDCVISHNLATGECGDTGDAGGVKLHDAGHLINSIVTDNYSSNSTARGGGVCCSWSISTIRHYIVNCVITNNKTNGTGGGIGNYGTSSSYTNAYNTILWNNYQDAAKNQIGGTSMTVRYCGVEGGYSGTGNYTLSSTNTDVAGPNFFDPNGGDWRLETTSPCINIGYNNAVNGSLSYLAAIDFDFAGSSRVLETTVDMGVYESAYIAPVLTIQPDGYGRVFVKSSSSGAANGSSWANATSWLQGAIDAAETFETNNPGTEAQVWVAEGTYYPTASIAGLESDTKGKSFILRNGVEIYGGFPYDADATNNSSLTSRSLGSCSVYLSGDVGQPGIESDNSYHVIWADVSNMGTTTVLDGFTITGGYASGTAPHDMGAGMYSTGSSPTISNCYLNENTASLGGGGMYLTSGASPVLHNCVFHDNTANNGGAAYCSSTSSAPVFNNCTLTKNTALVNGGAVYSDNCPSTFNNCIVWGNEAAGNGNEFFVSSQAVSLNFSCYANEAGDVVGSLTTGNCITSNPYFADEANDDYRLYSVSACVDAASNTYTNQSIDISGETRIQNSVVNMGAYEATTSSVVSFYVDADAQGANDGSSWINAYNYLQDALNDADLASGDTIWVAEGVYYPDEGAGYTNNDQSAVFSLIEGVKIYGGFAGNEAFLSERDMAANPTVLSGDIDKNDTNDDGNFTNQTADSISGSNSYHVLIADATNNAISSAAVIDGFIITGGYFSSGNPEYNMFGGGIVCYGEINESSPSISNCIFSGNHAGYGGAIGNYGPWGGNSSPSIVNCSFYGNYSSIGGAIFNRGVGGTSAPNIVNCSFSKNAASTGGGAIGSNGASGGSSPTLTNCILWGNSPASFWNDGITTSITYSVVEGSSVYTGTGNSNSDPEFVDADNGDLRIYGISPCVDAGNDAANSETTDIRGGNFERKLDKTDHSQIGTIDIGAYEFYEGTDPEKIYVDASHTSGTFNGTSWNTAYQYLQDALNHPNLGSGVQIWVAEGVYYPDEDNNFVNGDNATENDRSATFSITEGVAIYGGFTGTESNMSDRDPVTNLTVLSGDIQQDDTNHDGNFKNQTVDSLETVQSYNCYHVVTADGSSSEISPATVLDGFVISSGYANENSGDNRHGGGIYCNGTGSYASSPTIKTCTFSGNYGSGDGGAIYCAGSSGESSPIIDQCTFYGNSSLNSGGAICADASMGTSSPVIKNCRFSENTGALGGAICNVGSDGGNNTATIMNCIFYDNYNPIYNVAFSGTCSPSLINCTFFNNNGWNGGAVNNSGISGAIVSPTITNCILWGNSASNSGDNIYNDGANPIITYSLIEGGYSGTGNINADPIFADTASRDLRICGISPCSDVGDNTANSLEYDIRGKSRIQNSTIDMGAYEYTAGIDPIRFLMTIYVNTNASGNNDGTSWIHAFTNLQDAFDEAISGDSIWVAKGTYHPTSAHDLVNTSRQYHFRMIDGVAIYGGFSGIETSIHQRSDYGIGESNETILSGDLNDDDVVTGEGETLTFTNNNENCYHVIHHPSSYITTQASVLDGFTISGGNANSWDAYDCYGAGLLLMNSAATLNSLNLISNNALYTGGGMYLQNSVTVTNCKISHNATEYVGGGVTIGDNNPVFKNTTITKNKASVEGGGGVAIWAGNPIFINGLIAGNYTASVGGGIVTYYANCTPVFTNMTIANNSASAGGGIAFISGQPNGTFNNCIIYDNSASSGNQFYIDAGTTTLNYSCYANGTNDVAMNVGTFTATNHNITDDPMFVGTVAGDFRIFGISPCADSGNDSYNDKTTDIRGGNFERKLDKTDHTQTGTIDMGAYEYREGSDDYKLPKLYQSVGSGNWTTASVWDINLVPSYVDTVIINSGHTVTVSISDSISDVHLKSGGTIAVSGNSSLGIRHSLYDYGGEFDVSSGSNIVLKEDLKNAAGETKLEVLNSGSLSIEGDIEVEQGPLTVTDIDGNTYSTVTIGNQVWMAENLKVTKNPAGTAITRTCYDNSTSNCDTYGGLYDWATMMNGAASSPANPSGVQGICPTGWHIPSDAEWTELTTFLGGTTVAGGKLKETGTTHWYSPNTGATNSSGFTALPGGYLSGSSFIFLEAYGNWWSSTQNSSTHAKYLCMLYNAKSVVQSQYPKSYGYSVRCIQD